MRHRLLPPPAAGGPRRPAAAPLFAAQPRICAAAARRGGGTPARLGPTPGRWDPGAQALRPTEGAPARARKAEPQIPASVQPPSTALAARGAIDLCRPPFFLHQRRLLAPVDLKSRAFQELAASWASLGVDADAAGLCRRRTFSTMTQVGRHSQLQLDLHAPLFRRRDINALNGSIEPAFDPIGARILDNPLFGQVLHYGLRQATLAEAAAGRPWRWHVEAQQFRVEARPGAAGAPTPEGLHRDGRDYVLMMLIDRKDAVGAEFSLHLSDGRHVAALTLRRPSELVMVADRHLQHRIGALTPVPGRPPGHRDMLIFSFVNLATPSRCRTTCLPAVPDL